MTRTTSLFATIVVGAAVVASASERHSPRVRPLPPSLAAAETVKISSQQATRLRVGEADPGSSEDGGGGACVQRPAGGPDPFGYSFTDSDEPGGPVYQWVDVTLTGLPTDPLGYNTVVGPYPIGFEFTFYGAMFTDFYVSSGGYLELGSDYSSVTNRCPLPDSGPPNNIIAIMWDHLDPADTDDPVYYQTFGAGSCPWDGYPGACLVVLYDDFCFYPGGGACSSAGTWEAILFDDHSIVMQFLDAGSEGGLRSTTGIENSGGHLGLTYACNTGWSLHEGLAIRFDWAPPPPVVLAAAEPDVDACRRTLARHELTLVNNTGSATSFDILYNGFDWEVSGDAIVGPVEHLGAAIVPLIHRLPDDAVPGDFDTGTVTAQDQAGPDSASVDITTTVGRYVTFTGRSARNRLMDQAFIIDGNDYAFAIGGRGGRHPPGTPPVLAGLPSGLDVSPEATVNILRLDSLNWYIADSDSPSIPFAGDMAHGIDVSGEAVAIAFPDASGLSDALLHVFNLDYPGFWTRRPPPAGFPSQGIWAHDIACDETANLCYISGGATAPGGGDLTTVYVYDVNANTVTQLPGFTSPRAHHASFLLDGQLCIAGGIDASGVALASTQCFDLAAGAWGAENADLGPLPGTLWGMGDAVMEIEGELRPVLAAGILHDGHPGTHFLWHDGTAWQYDDPFHLGVYRTEAVAVGDQLFLVGGAARGLWATNVFQTLDWCPTEPPPNDNCADAIEVPLYDCVTVTNVLASDSGPPLPTCADYQGGDVWARITVPAGEELWAHSLPASGSPVSDTGMTLYVECPHQIELQCDDDTWNQFSQVGPLTGPGTWWIRAWAKGNDVFGDFRICGEGWIPVELTSFLVE